MKLNWRPLTPSDAGALARLYAATEEVEPAGLRYDVEQLRGELELPGLDLNEASTAVWDGGRLVAAAMLVPRDAAERVHQMGLNVIVHPDYRRDHLGEALLGWAEHAASLLHVRLFPDSALELHTNPHENQGWLRELLPRVGFVRARAFATMRTSLDEIAEFKQAPDDLPLVRFEPRYDELVRGARNDTFAEHWGNAPVSARTWRHRVTNGRSFLPELSLLLLSAQRDQVVAFVLSSSREADQSATGMPECWLDLIGTRRAVRGRGLATALIGHALRDARARGFARAALAVDEDNADNALEIYRRCGFEVSERTFSYVKVVSSGSLR